jgi:ribose transport system substrate-binding protein
LDGLQEMIGEIPETLMTHLESGISSEESEQRMAAVLKELPKANRLAVITMNDDAALGALTAARKAHREHCVVIIGQGADRRVREQLRKPDSRIIGSTAFWPERYGERILSVAFQVLKGEPVPPAVYIDHVFITPENISNYYPG